MNAEIHTLDKASWRNEAGLRLLQEIPQPPDTLYYQGTLPTDSMTLLSVVGSRQYTTYGRQVVETLIGQLAGYPVGIVSGLAKGIDSLAHEAALQAGLYTLAIPGSGLNRNVLYPKQNQGLADRIIQSGGGLLSELTPDTKAARFTFPQRNRLMAGVSQATLVIEAGEKSGTLITARMTVDYNRELLVVPGSIFSPQSQGVHQFLKLGATPVTSGEDIAEVLGVSKTNNSASTDTTTYTETEQTLLDLLTEPADIDSLIQQSNLPAQTVSATLMELEIKGNVLVVNGLYQRKI